MLRWLGSSRRSIAVVAPRLNNSSNSGVALFLKSWIHWSSRSRPSLHNYYLRKRRKWPLSPYKTKWQQNFAHQQAFLTFQKSAKRTSKSHLLSTLIDSFATYNCEPSPNVYHFILKILTQKPSRVDQIPHVLDHIQKVAAFETPEYIFIDLIKYYGDCNMLQQAVELFFRIPHFRCSPSVHSLNALLSVLCKKKRGLEMIPGILMKSQLINIRIEESSFEILIKALCRSGTVNYAVELLNYMVSDGLTVDGRIFSLILATMFEEKERDEIQVMLLFEDLKKLGFNPDLGDWGNVIRFLVERGNSMDAMEALNLMKRDGIEPDIVCYNWVLDRLVFEGHYVKADELFDKMLLLGLVPDIFTYNAYINSLCKQNKMEEGIKMLTCMEELGCRPDLTTYNTIIGACCGNGDLNLARMVLKETKCKGTKLSFQTYELLIVGCFNNHEIDEACGLLREMVDNFSVTKSMAVDQILCGLCQRGSSDMALKLLKEMVAKNVAPGFRAWEALLRGSALTYSFEVNSVQAYNS